MLGAYLWPGSGLSAFEPEPDRPRRLPVDAPSGFVRACPFFLHPFFEITVVVRL
ncbi:hypothetical protein APED_17975 [Acanthopleuribacter pedis]